MCGSFAIKSNSFSKGLNIYCVSPHQQSDVTAPAIQECRQRCDCDTASRKPRGKQSPHQKWRLRDGEMWVSCRGWALAWLDVAVSEQKQQEWPVSLLHPSICAELHRLERRCSCLSTASSCSSPHAPAQCSIWPTCEPWVHRREVGRAAPLWRENL